MRNTSLETLLGNVCVRYAYEKSDNNPVQTDYYTVTCTSMAVCPALWIDL